VVAVICIVAAALFLLILNLLPLPGSFSRVFLGNAVDGTIHPFSIQNFTWLAFFIALGELWVRLLYGMDEEREVRRGHLPAGNEMLRPSDLGPIVRRVREKSLEDLFLPRLVLRTAFQFQASRSVAQASDVLKSSLDLLSHEIDLRYNMVRYLVWLIPTLGFIGTVVGISGAMGVATKEGAESLDKVTAELAVAFDTTLVALLLSGVVVFLMHLIQEKEERALNSAGQYCLDNLINRLFEKQEN